MKKFSEILSKLNRRACSEMPMSVIAIQRRAVALLRRSGVLRSCLQPGETAPDFPFSDQHGDSHRLYSLLEKGPVVVSFFRGFWCPYCRAELDAFKEIVNELNSYDAQFIAVSPQAMDGFGEEDNYYAVVDESNAIAKQFGIVYTLSREEKELFSGWGVSFEKTGRCGEAQLPLPGTYLITPDRIIYFSHVEVDYKERLDPTEIIEELSRHRAKSRGASEQSFSNQAKAN